MQTLRVLHVAPELAPLSGEGDNAEVARALSGALCALRRGIRLTVATLHDPERDPEARGLARRLEPLRLAMPGGEVEVPVHEGLLPSGGVEALVADYEGGGDPFEVLTRLALERADHRNQWPHIVHAWDRAPIAATLAKEPPASERPAPAVVLSLSEPDAPISEELAAALRAADRVVVDSPRRARDLLAAGGDLVQALGDPSKLRGVVHGIDGRRWNPEQDPHLSAPYDAETRTEKANLKRELQRQLGLPPRPNVPLVGAVGPFDLLGKDAVGALGDLSAQLAFLIDPDRDVDAAAALIAAAKRHPTRIAAREVGAAAAREALMHRMVAGADFWLLPRLPTPRGYLELYCLAYGTLPIAPRAGAFADVLVDVDPVTATGSGFLYHPVGEDLPAALARAERAYRSRGFEEVADRAMRMDLSWRTVARRYADVYREALRRSARASQGEKVDRVVA